MYNYFYNYYDKYYDDKIPLKSIKKKKKKLKGIYIIVCNRKIFANNIKRPRKNKNYFKINESFLKAKNKNITNKKVLYIGCSNNLYDRVSKLKSVAFNYKKTRKGGYSLAYLDKEIKDKLYVYLISLNKYHKVFKTNMKLKDCELYEILYFEKEYGMLPFANMKY